MQEVQVKSIQNTNLMMLPSKLQLTFVHSKTHTSALDALILFCAVKTGVTISLPRYFAKIAHNLQKMHITNFVTDMTGKINLTQLTVW
jgi:hypothetical protein